MMHPLSRTYRCVVFPLSLGLFLACIVLAAILMSINADKFVIAFVFLIFCGAIPFCVLYPAFLPLIRRIVAKAEAEKYDFHEWLEVENEAEYRYEYQIGCNAFLVDRPPFAELAREEKTEGTGAVALKQALADIMEEGAKEIPHPEPPPLYPPFFLNDYTENVRYASFEIKRSPQSDEQDLITVSERQELIFGEKGVKVKDSFFPYEEITARIETANPLMLARILLSLRLSEDLYACIKLDKQSLHVLKRFHIRIENEDVLQTLVYDTEGAFRQIIKYGKIKHYKLNFDRSVISYGRKKTRYCRELEDEQHRESGR